MAIVQQVCMGQRETEAVVRVWGNQKKEPEQNETKSGETHTSEMGRGETKKVNPHNKTTQQKPQQ